MTIQATKPAIEIAHVSKRFVLQGPRAGDLRELAGEWRDRVLKRQVSEPTDRDFWALRDVSFTVEPGHPMGIVGHNGSGKSTLLKMLTGILKPTTGRVQVAGRIGALIEVGAGFHPDLTGRENVYLNGSILGLSRREIDRKLDAIVSFANLEQFIDTPVKRYSSGMYMRLGFSVAAHTDPDVMLIDEVLAVGDTLFQRKCMRKLKEFVHQGGAVVFVSHAMSYVAELCPTCVWLDRGQVRFVGPTEDAVDQYMEVVAEREEEDFKRNHPHEWEARETLRREAEEAALLAAEEDERRREEEARRIAEEQEKERERLVLLRTEEEKRLAEAEAENKARVEAERAAHAAWLADPRRARFTGYRLLDRNGKPTSTLRVLEPFQIEMEYRFGRPLPHPVFCMEVYREDGLYMFATNSYMHGLNTRNLPLQGRVILEVPTLTLNEGTYRMILHLFPDCDGDDFYQKFRCEERIEAFTFHVDAGSYGGYGCTYLPLEWRIAEPDTRREYVGEREVALAKEK